MLFVTAVDTMDVAILTVLNFIGFGFIFLIVLEQGIQILASLFNYGFRMSRPYYHIKYVAQLFQ